MEYIVRLEIEQIDYGHLGPRYMPCASDRIPCDGTLQGALKVFCATLNEDPEIWASRIKDSFPHLANQL